MMLIWIANLPEEIPFYTVRMQGEWAPVGIALIIGHFVIPFCAPAVAGPQAQAAPG